MGCGPGCAHSRNGVHIANGEIVSRIDHDVGPGPFEGTTGTSSRSWRIFRAEIQDCARNVEIAAKTWANEHELSCVKETLYPGYLTAQFIKDGLEGVFVVYYYRESDKSAAHLKFTFEDGSGRSRQAEIIKGYGADIVAPKLWEAATCR